MDCVRASFFGISFRALRAEPLRFLFATVAHAGQTLVAVTEGRIANHARHHPLEALCFCARGRVGLVRRTVLSDISRGEGGGAGVRLRLCMLLPAAVSLPNAFACVPPCACGALRNGSRALKRMNHSVFVFARKYIALTWNVFVQGLLLSRAPCKRG